MRFLGKLAVIFNGQGAHYQGMGMDFDKKYSQAKKIFDLAETELNLPIRCWIEDDFEALKFTENAQPTILATSLAIYEVIKNILPAIDYMAGLSLGEYSALIAGGHLALSDGLKIVKSRGQIMSQECQVLDDAMEVQMAAMLEMPKEEIEAIVGEIHSDASPLYLANYNSTQQTVVAGSKEAIKEFKLEAKARGYRKLIPLKVEGPFHTPMMEEVSDSFQVVLDNAEFLSDGIPVIRNLDANPHQANQAKSSLVKHLTHPVQWLQTVEYLSNAGVSHVIQIGPGHTLKKLIESDNQPLQVYAVDKVEDVDGLSQFLKEAK